MDYQYVDSVWLAELFRRRDSFRALIWALSCYVENQMWARVDRRALHVQGSRERSRPLRLGRL